jgi:hypothetical protein
MGTCGGRSEDGDPFRSERDQGNPHLTQVAGRESHFLVLSQFGSSGEVEPPCLVIIGWVLKKAYLLPP